MLTKPQQEKIEHYLLDWNLEYKDFYDEVLDHFVEGVDRKMTDGQDFEAAFKLTKEDFSGKKIKSYRGLKAFEEEYATAIKAEYKKELRKRMLLQFTSWRVLIWLFIFFLVFRFWQSREEIYFNLLIGACGITFLLPLFLIPRENFQNRFWGEFVTSHWPVEKRKRKLLFKKSRHRLMWQSFTGGLGLFGFLLMNGSNTFRVFFNINSKPAGFDWVQIGLLLLLFSLMWAFLELSLKERRLELQKTTK